MHGAPAAGEPGSSGGLWGKDWGHSQQTGSFPASSILCHFTSQRDFCPAVEEEKGDGTSSSSASTCSVIKQERWFPPSREEHFLSKEETQLTHSHPWGCTSFPSWVLGLSMMLRCIILESLVLSILPSSQGPACPSAGQVQHWLVLKGVNLLTFNHC